ncbi:MAG: ABC transporter permease [Acidimicrobiia bacterium]
MSATSLDRIRAITRRDFRLRMSYPFELLSSLWGVAISVFMFYFIGRLVGDTTVLSGLEGGYFAFAVIGVTVMGLSFSILEVFRSSIQSEQANGTLELLLASPTSLRTFMMGSLVVPMGFAGVEAVAYAVFGWILAPEVLGPSAWLRAVPVLLLVIGAFAAMGLWSAAFVVFAQRGDPVSGMFVQATNLLAGAVFPVAVLPDWLQTLARMVPTFYGFEALRGLMLADASWASVLDEIAILAAFDIVLVAVGMWLLGRALRFARVMGTLGTG